MNIEFNYKTIPFYFLSLFSIVLILSLTNFIKYDFALYYSIVAIVICVAFWWNENKIRSDANVIRTEYGINPLSDSEYFEKLKEVDENSKNLLIVLLVSFIFAVFIYSIVV
jgi:cytochrome b